MEGFRLVCPVYDSTPGQFKLSQIEQQKDKMLIEKAKASKVDYKVKDFHRSRLTRAKATIRHHFTWKNHRHSVEQVHKKYHLCQLTKKLDPNIGHLPAKQAQ
eukprot:3404206-Ditylum_brightwellii.AAC.1